MRLILGGGGDEKQSAVVDGYFRSLFPGRRSRLLYVPIALRGKIPFDACLAWFKGVFGNDFDIVMVTDMDSLPFELDSFDAIYIGGGNTFSLMKECVASGFGEKLRTYASGGGVIYGGSAGAIILGQTISTSTDENAVGLEIDLGLGMIDGFSVWPHFDVGQSAAISTYARDNSLGIIALSESSGALIVDGVITSLSGDVLIFSSSGTRKILPKGASMEI